MNILKYIIYSFEPRSIFLILFLCILAIHCERQTLSSNSPLNIFFNWCKHLKWDTLFYNNPKFKNTPFLKYILLNLIKLEKFPMNKLMNLGRNYENFRWFFTSNKVLVVGGKSDEQNELVIRDFLKPNYIIMHTSLPGSPFMIIQSDNPLKVDLEETAIFCASFSQQWKSGKKNIDIDIFKGEQIYKTKDMKTGTFGVKGNKKTMKVRPELALVLQKGKLRAVPKTTKEEKLARIIPGKLSKEEACEKISKTIKDRYHFPISKDEIMSTIPSGNLEVR